MYEHRHQPLLPRRLFIRRVARNSLFALGLVFGSLALGILGYRFLAGLAWVDALLNSAMLLGGMGPVDPLSTVPAKLFASFYALFAGIIFLVAAGVFFAPLYHRFLHHFHLEVHEPPPTQDEAPTPPLEE